MQLCHANYEIREQSKDDKLKWETIKWSVVDCYICKKGHWCNHCLNSDQRVNDIKML